MRVTFRSMMEDARKGGYAVGYFEAWDLYSLEAVVDAAEALQAPAIVGFGEAMTDPDWYEAGGIERCAALGRAAVARSSAPLCLIYNEVATYEHCVRGAKAGFDVVMLDSSELPHDEHLRLTQNLVREAHGMDVAVEAELGELPTAGSSQGGGSLTDPEEAAAFVEQTGIDSLSVSIGNVHLMEVGFAAVDLERLTAIHRATGAPLVLHGGSGFPDDAVAETLRCGVTKYNVGTILKKLFLEGMMKALKGRTAGAGIHELMGSRRGQDVMEQGKARMREEVIRRMRVYNPGLGV